MLPGKNVSTVALVPKWLIQQSVSRFPDRLRIRFLITSRSNATRGRMRRYFFDVFADDRLTIDHDGMDLPDIRRVEEEAVRTLAEMVRDKARESRDYQMAVEVRDLTGSLFQVQCTFVRKHQR
jgi:hypothetical protein